MTSPRFWTPDEGLDELARVLESRPLERRDEIQRELEADAKDEADEEEGRDGRSD